MGAVSAPEVMLMMLPPPRRILCDAAACGGVTIPVMSLHPPFKQP